MASAVLNFQIKVCGVTSPGDALAAVNAGADAIGLNFFSGSPRFVPDAVAKEIADAIRGRAVCVGVFVNVPAADVIERADAVGLDCIQLHGDGGPEMLAELKGRNVLRAVRGATDGLAPATSYLECCGRMGALPAAVLWDGFRRGEYGGTGRTADWEAATDFRNAWPDMPLILAGGLTPENVAAAIRQVRPSAVDTASGVESAPGRKDAGIMKAFVDSARAAFASLRPTA